MPHINALELLLATLAVIAIFGPKSLTSLKHKHESETVDLSAIVEREREVLRPDFGQEPDARRSVAGAPRAIRPQSEQKTAVRG